MPHIDQNQYKLQITDELLKSGILRDCRFLLQQPLRVGDGVVDAAQKIFFTDEIYRVSVLRGFQG